MTSQIGRVDPFELGTDNWEQYTERLEQYFVANEITDDAKKLAVFLTVIGTKTYGLLCSLLAPDKPATKTYTDLVAAVKDHVDPKPLIIAERFRFHRRNQGEGETVAEYMAHLRKLADKCGFGNHLNEALRDRLVCGLRQEAIQRKLLTVEGLTVQKAYEIAHSMEVAEKRASELQQSTKPATVQPPRKPQTGYQQKPTPDTTHQKGVGPTCHRCGGTSHPPERCYYRTQQCRRCGGRGHIARVCRNPKVVHRTDYVGGEEGHSVEGGPEDSNAPPQTETTDQFLFNINNLHTRKAGIMLELQLDGKPCTMELDTGASVTIVSEEVWKGIASGQPLDRSFVKLTTYTGESIEILGQKDVLVEYRDQQCRLPLVVVGGSGPALFGRNWLEKLKLDWGSINNLRTELGEILKKHEAIFKDELGTLKGVEVHLDVDPQAQPKFYRPRSVPYAIKGAIEQDLERLEKLGIVEKVSYSDWAAPIVPVPKPDGSIRICGDYKVTVNPALRVDQYPMPTAEDLFATLAGGKAFTKLDLSRAYMQVMLDESSQRYVTVNTHKGLYRYKRLPFGVASAPAVFQQIMEQMLQGIPGVVVYLDDILITGGSEREHLDTLGRVLQVLEQHGLRLKKEKCRFMVRMVDYLGYRVDQKGLQPIPNKVTALTEAPEPGNVQELRAFLGLVNYYGKFMENLATITHPLHRLLCKGTPWVWSQQCKEAFILLKSKLASAEVLAHYDPTLPVKLDCDASAYGVGAVLSHQYPDGSERPIAYASRTLSSAEKNYAQLEKEALALIFGVKKFHKYLYGRRFTLVTDHKPLLAILGSKKSLPTLAAARLQRWAIFLLGYQYDLEFRPTGKHCNADGFSRLPRKHTTDEEEEVDFGASACNLVQIETLPVSAKELQQATMADPVLSTVLRYAQEGWPADVVTELNPYFQRRGELSLDRGCLFLGNRVIVPLKFQGKVLQELHTGHQGIVKMKGLARSHVWWPGIDRQVEGVVRNCDACQETRNKPPAMPLHPWPWPETPWERIHVDFAGPFMGSMFFVIVDGHSRWLEVKPMETTTTEKTVEVLRETFARFGLPRQLVSDNGPQFTSREFEEFLARNGVHHLRSAPYHPATNGAAERFVQTFKQALRAGKNDQGTMAEKLSRFLMTYRNTPHSTTGVSPAELFLKRRPRTRLDVMTGDKVLQKQVLQKNAHDKRCRQREFEVGETVWARNLREGPKWMPGVICNKTGPVSYEVNVEGQVWRRHAEQLLRKAGTSGNNHPESGVVDIGDIDDEVPDADPVLLGVPATPAVATAPAEDSVATDDTGAATGADPNEEQSSPHPGSQVEVTPPVVASPKAPTQTKKKTTTVWKSYPQRVRRKPQWL